MPLLLTACVSTTPPPAKLSPNDLAVAREAVRQAEIGFATAFKERDTEKFLSYLEPESRFLGPQGTLNGPEELREGWKGLLAGPTPPFTWTPARVEINADGTLGLSIGPISDSNGKHVADYSSIWQKKPDGTWKVIFDGPGCSLAE